LDLVINITNRAERVYSVRKPTLGTFGVQVGN